MTNADKIRQMSDEQLSRFLWTWKINSITTFLTQGGMNSMNAKDMREWLGQTTDSFVGKHADQMIIDEMLAIKKIIDDGKMPQTETHDIRTNTHECVNDKEQTERSE